MVNNRLCFSVALASSALLAVTPAKADYTTPPVALAPPIATIQAAAAPAAPVATAPAAAAPAAAAPVVAEPASAVPPTMPVMAGPLGLNTTPFTFKVGSLGLDIAPISFDAGPAGKVYVSGVASAMGMLQDHAASANSRSITDLTNGQVFIQNTTGPAQFYLQAGTYSLPTIGTTYLRDGKTPGDTFGYLPVGYLKYVPDSSFSFMAGKLPTLLGGENVFSFQNMDIERGLLRNQENDINHGIQGNYAGGPLAVSLSWNDGFYSSRYNWLTGLATYTIDSTDTVAFDGGGNITHSARNSLATLVAQNNSSVYDLIYTHKDGPWTYKPYLQYTFVPQDKAVGIMNSASTYGGAFLAKYNFDQNINFAGRVEYIRSLGDAASGAPNLLYGQGSSAYSLTLTPTYQMNIFFARLEASYVRALKLINGDAFGLSGTDPSQERLMFETGIMF